MKDIIVIRLKKYAPVIRVKFSFFQDKIFFALFCVPKVKIRCVHVHMHMCMRACCKHVHACSCVCAQLCVYVVSEQGKAGGYVY